jgi:hypothetical protein
MNKIYSLMEAGNSPYVSNILVTDIRNDINKAITLCSFNEFGILYKEQPLLNGDDKPLIDHFELLLYPFKTFTQVHHSTDDLVSSYNTSFTYTNKKNSEIAAMLDDVKMCAHKFVDPSVGDLVAINNYLQLNALIATSTRVSEAEADDILKNVKVALVNEFNMRNLDFGEEIPFESILSVIENADARIKVVSLQDPILLTTYSVKEETQEGNTTVSTSKEYGIASTAPDFVRIKGVSYGSTKVIETADGPIEVDRAKEIYNKLVLRNVLAGRAALFKYDDTFLASNSEQPYTITRDVTTDFVEGLNQLAERIETLTEEDPDITEDEIETAIQAEFANDDSLLIRDAIKTLIEELDEDAAASESILDGVGGHNNGVLTLRVYPESEARITGRPAYVYAYTDSEGATQYFFCNIYETYEYDFTASPATISPADGDDEGVTPAMYRLTRGSGVRSGAAATPVNVTSSGVIKDIKEVKASCKINSATNVFNDITLAKNEVIKFRAPNLITTKTFPAYVYYNYTKGNGATSDTTRAITSSGSYATIKSLKTFINSIGISNFLSDLCNTNIDNLVQLTFERDSNKLDESNTLPEIFNAAIVIFHTTVNNKTAITSTSIDKIISSKGDLIAYLNSLPTEITEETFYYYPLNSGTLNAWRTCISRCYENKYSESLPDGNILWRLSSTYSHPQGRLVINTHQKLLEVTGDHLASMSVGDEVYICTAYGQEPKFYTIPENGDVQLESGDKLYIHYTPSSTNEDGETENAEPVSIVYEGGKTDEPVILRPSGFTLIPSEDVYRQGASWKKTEVPFGSEKVNLLALAPNEQIELRSVSKVVLNTPARFYKNFDNEGLEKGTITEYELKDGEYIFYTNQSTQEAAYYGSGSVVTLSGGAYIPKTDGLKDVSQILTQGLHVAPWSSVIQLSDSRTVTITEYQYVTLVEGDTITSITVDETAIKASQIDSQWKACSGAVYTSTGAASPSVLPDIELASGDGWEVCSRLELSTWPGQAQELRAVSTSSSPAIFVGSTGPNSISVTCNSDAITFTDNDSSDVFSYSIENNIVKLRNSTTGEEVTTASITLSNGVPANATYNSVAYSLSSAAEPDATPVISDEIEVTTVTAAGNESSITIKPQQTAHIDTTEFEPVSVKLNVIAQSASGNLGVEKVDDIADIAGTLMQMKVFKDSPPALVELSNINEAITPISNKSAMSVDYSSESINNYWTKLDVGLAFHNNSNIRALSLNLLIPEDSDLFGVFSVYLDTSAKLASADDNGIPENGARVFIDVPKELGAYNEVISIYNNEDTWWSSGIDQEGPYHRLYLRAGLNCIKVLKSCNLLIKAEANASGNILYDNMQLVEGRETNGVNLKLIDFDAVSITKDMTNDDKTRADNLLKKIAELDPGHEFYYNVPVEDSLAIEFDQVVNSFSNPHTLYDINNVNNSFVISKLDVAYLDSGLKIARSSRYKGV